VGQFAREVFLNQQESISRKGAKKALKIKHNSIPLRLCGNFSFSSLGLKLTYYQIELSIDTQMKPI
jgi:hypothetical protein